MDIQNVDDKQYTVTLNAFFVLRWTDRRIIIDQENFQDLLVKGKLTFTYLQMYWQYFIRKMKLHRYKPLVILTANKLSIL